MKKSVLVFAMMIVASFAFAQKYFVCLNSYALEQNALDFQNEMKSVSVPVFIEEAESKSGTKLFRVILDMPKDSKAEARSLRDKVERSKIAREKNLFGLWILASDHVTVKSTNTSEKPIVPVQNIVEEPVEEAPLVVEKPFEAPVETPEPEINIIETASHVETALEVNEVIPVSEDRPYSLLIDSYKEEDVANNNKDRLLKKEIDAYVLKKVRENENITFDLHAGSEEKAEDLESLAEKLDELEITYEITDYKDFAEEVEMYDQVVQAEKIVSDSGVYEIPEEISEPVKEILLSFPINRDFQLESLSIFDVDNILNSGIEDTFEGLNNEFVLNFVPNAFSMALYTDTLYNNKVSIYISTFNEDVKDAVYSELKAFEDFNSFLRVQDFAIKDGTLKTWLFKDLDSYILLGYSEEQKMLIFMSTRDLSEEQFVEFLEDSWNNENLLIYPQIRRTFCVMPKAKNNNFLSYRLSKIGMEYVEEKNYAEWAWGIYGHWEASFIFENEIDNFNVSFFDLDYDYNAEKVHGLFMKEKNGSSINDWNHFVDVNGCDGWYLMNLRTHELSFARMSYILAINSEFLSPLEEEDLLEIADSLLIW